MFLKKICHPELRRRHPFGSFSEGVLWTGSRIALSFVLSYNFNQRFLLHEIPHRGADDIFIELLN